MLLLRVSSSSRIVGSVARRSANAAGVLQTTGPRMPSLFHITNAIHRSNFAIKSSSSSSSPSPPSANKSGGPTSIYIRRRIPPPPPPPPPPQSSEMNRSNAVPEDDSSPLDPEVEAMLNSMGDPFIVDDPSQFQHKVEIVQYTKPQPQQPPQQQQQQQQFDASAAITTTTTTTTTTDSTPASVPSPSPSTSNAFYELNQSLNQVIRRLEQNDNSIRVLQDNVSKLNAMVSMMAAQHLLGRVTQTLRTHGVVATEHKNVPFTNILNIQKLRDFVLNFVGRTHTFNIQESVTQAIPKQRFVNLVSSADVGSVTAVTGFYTDSLVYSQACAPTTFITTSVNLHTGVRNSDGTKSSNYKGFVSGDVLVTSDVRGIVTALGRCVRIPTLAKRFLARVYRAVNRCSVEDAITASDKAVIVLLLGSFTPESKLAGLIPPNFFNNVLSSKDIFALEEHVLSKMEGEVYLPPDNDMRHWVLSDPIQDSLGIWRIFLDSEHNGKPLGQCAPSSERDVFALLLILRLMAMQNFDLLLATTSSNPHTL